MLIHESPALSHDTLESLLDSAPAAIPEALQVGRFLGEVPAEDVYALVTELNDALGRELTYGWLVMQYALTIILCAQQVVHLSVSF